MYEDGQIDYSLSRIPNFQCSTQLCCIKVVQVEKNIQWHVFKNIQSRTKRFYLKNVVPFLRFAIYNFIIPFKKKEKKLIRRKSFHFSLNARMLKIFRTFSRI